MIGLTGASRYAEAIRRIFGEAEICPPGMTLEADRPEWSYVKRENLYGFRRVEGAVAAQFGTVVLQNPAAGRVLVVIKELWMIGGAFIVCMDPVLSALPLIAGGFPRDSRLIDVGSFRASQSRIRSGTQAAAVGGQVGARNAGQLYEQPIVLEPGGQVTFQCTTVNVQIDSCIAWTERPIRDEEIAE